MAFIPHAVLHVTIAVDPPLATALTEFLMASLAEQEQSVLRMDCSCADHGQRDANCPDFILADIEAKRAIAAAYVDSKSRRDIYQSAEARAVEDDRQQQRRRAEAARCRGLEIAVQALAFTFADRPGYREEWRP